MVMRKMIFLMALMAVMMFFSPKKIYAGTCSCEVNAGRTWYISNDNCDNDEYASGCTGSAISDPSQSCNCKKKTTTGAEVNTCTCNGSGAILTNNCQGSTPVPYCNTRGSVICQCSGNGTIETIGRETTTTTEEGSGGVNYNPFKGCTNNEVNTALGCVPTTVESFIPWLLKYLFGIAGGIAFLLMVYGFILVATSGGDEKKVAGAKETITSAIIGLLVCIFAIFILRLVAVNILHIPGIN